MMMQKKLLYFLLLFALACSPKANTSETGMPLPVNVIEKIEQRYPSKEDKNGAPKKAVYIDTTSKEIISEKYFYESGKVYIEQNFKSGLKNGTAIAYRDTTGTPWSLHTYVNDTLNGPYKTWHPNGGLMMEGQYEMGKKAGSWRFFDPSGGVTKIINFSDSIPD